jgi:hypothetical protein
MRKKILLAAFCLSAIFANAQLNLTQINFTGNIVPQVMGSLTATRLPVIYRATLSGLAPNTTYRYFTNLAIATDIGTTNSGAGNPLYISTSTIRYSTGASLSSPGNYDSLLTNGSGSYTGWFAVVNTGNTRFTGGNHVYPSIVLDSAGSKRGIINSRLCMSNDSIRVLTYATAAGSFNGSFIRGTSLGTPKSLVLLYTDTAGTSRPISIGIIESLGVTIASIVPDYATNVSSINGAWGTIVPNLLSTGVRRIEQRSASTGNYLSHSTSTNGSWGSTNTVNPLNGSATALIISSANAPLPVNITSFHAIIDKNQTILSWSTSSESNNKGFEIERSNNGIDFETIGFVAGAGNSNKLINYSFLDESAHSTIAYYRLNQIDFDGKSTYSEILTLNSDELNFDITPNPFADQITINASNAEQVISAEVMDLSGKVKLNASNSGMVNIDTRELSQGIYFIRINNGEKVIVKRIIKN